MKTIGVAVAGVGLIAGPAVADVPTRESESVVGEKIQCGDTVLKVVRGSFLFRGHEHQKKNGMVQEVFRAKLMRVVLTDASGTRYRAVGVIGGSFTFDPATDRGKGTFVSNINFIGPDGKFGDIKERFKVRRDGQVVQRVFGSCDAPS